MGNRCCCEDNYSLDELTKRNTGIAIPSPTVESCSPTVVIGFVTPDGEHREVTLSQRPLGMNTTKSPPFTVTAVRNHSHAHDLGIRTGWKLRHIDGEDIFGKTAVDVQMIFNTKTTTLPEVT
uniref:PDZ domain-containing protein n=1 Tax=Noctiluca scintillans TaxID=2966 RepID=A0A7S1B018_NOCSC|mmetsp:Transcript_7053/g.19365  ORF Transcript_7053/g.19365 Transcript_7053/m.19365 type:complete len:122 (+) Transcript_7053:69-434(+)